MRGAFRVIGAAVIINDGMASKAEGHPPDGQLCAAWATAGPAVGERVDCLDVYPARFDTVSDNRTHSSVAAATMPACSSTSVAAAANNARAKLCTEQGRGCVSL